MLLGLVWGAAAGRDTVGRGPEMVPAQGVANFGLVSGLDSGAAATQIRPPA